MNPIATLICLLICTTGLSFAQIAGLKPAPGSLAEGKITVSAGTDGATEIPVIVIRGAKAGPTLAVITGLSGTEYGPIGALQQFPVEFNAAGMSGTLVLVPIANVPAFLGRSIYVNPTDRKDLTRAFPGKADGTQTERIAEALMTQVIDKSDAVVVIGAGGLNTMLAPHVFQEITGDTKLDAKMTAMVLTFGISYIVTERAVAKTSLEGVVLAKSKPLLKAMCGAFGMNDARTVDMINRGIKGVLNALEMTKDHPGKTRSPVYFNQITAMTSAQSGILQVYVQRGQNVRKGEPVYGLAGLSGKNPQIVNSPVDGIVLAITVTPPVNKGETVLVMGIPREP